MRGMGAHYTLGVHYLYIKRNAKKVWGARYRSVHVMYQKMRYLEYQCFYCMFRRCRNAIFREPKGS
jgi:hypothetical protein